jgi:hypothetical protein
VTFAQQLQNSFFHANRARIERGQAPLHKGDYMQQVYVTGYDDDGNPQYKYKNKDSARRAYDKVTKGQTSGRNLSQAGGKPRVVDTILRGKLKGTHLGGGRLGLWKVNVQYAYAGDEGEEVYEYRSFMLESSQYTSMLDVPYLEAIAYNIIMKHSQYWNDHGSVPQDFSDMVITIQPIRASHITKEMEQARGTWGTDGQAIVNIDGLEIE